MAAKRPPPVPYNDRWESPDTGAITVATVGNWEESWRRYWSDLINYADWPRTGGRTSQVPIAGRRPL